MKKLFIIVCTLVFSGALAFAQTSAPADQAGAPATTKSMKHHKHHKAKKAKKAKKSKKAKKAMDAGSTK